MNTVKSNSYMGMNELKGGKSCRQKVTLDEACAPHPHRVFWTDAVHHDSMTADGAHFTIVCLCLWFSSRKVIFSEIPKFSQLVRLLSKNWNHISSNRRKLFLKYQVINLVILYIVVKKTVQIIYLNVVLESLQARLTEILAGNAPTGNSSHYPRWCWKRLSISSLFTSLSLVVGLKYKIIKS